MTKERRLIEKSIAEYKVYVDGFNMKLCTMYKVLKVCYWARKNGYPVYMSVVRREARVNHQQVYSVSTLDFVRLSRFGKKTLVSITLDGMRMFEILNGIDKKRSEST